MIEIEEWGFIGLNGEANATSLRAKIKTDKIRVHEVIFCSMGDPRRLVVKLCMMGDPKPSCCCNNDPIAVKLDWINVSWTAQAMCVRSCSRKGVSSVVSIHQWES